MTVADSPASTAAALVGTLTFEQYMAEDEIKQRYDIVDGVRIFMPAPSWRHQRISFNITMLLRRFEEQSGIGLALGAPFDVLIRRVPRLQTRQPDVLFLTHALLTQGGGLPETGPMTVAPELIVEIVSDSETERILNEKLSDFCAIGVQEAWVVRPVPRTVDVLRLTTNGSSVVATYTEGQTLQSLIFPTLALPVTDFFKP